MVLNTPTEVLAFIVAIVIIVKCVFIINRPKFMIKWTDNLLNRPKTLVLIYLLLILIVGAYLFMEMTIIQFAAAMLLAVFLFDMLLVIYSPAGVRQIVRDAWSRMSWMMILVFFLFAVWILVALFTY